MTAESIVPSGPGGPPRATGGLSPLAPVATAAPTAPVAPTAPATPLAPVAVVGPRAAALSHRGRRPEAPPSALPLLTVDVLAALLASAVPGTGRAGGWATVVLVLTVSALLARAGLYGARSAPPPPRAPFLLDELPALCARIAAGWLLLAVLLAVLGPRQALTLPALATGCLVHSAASSGGRGTVHWARRRTAARRPHPALVIGPPAPAQRVAAALLRHPACGVRPVGVATAGVPEGDGYGGAGSGAGQDGSLRDGAPPAPHTPLAPHTPHTPDGPIAPGGPGLLNTLSPPVGELPVLLSLPDVRRALVQNSVRTVLVLSSAWRVPYGTSEPRDPYAPLLWTLAEHGCRAWRLETEPAGHPHEYAYPHTAPHGYGARHLAGFPCTPLLPPPPPRTPGKRTLDVIVSAVLLLLAAPVLTACAAAVRWADGPGVIFRQERIGKDGRPFTLLKFRTLRPADSHEATIRWNIADEPRMSRVCRFLRRTSLDELPQLWNVFRGDMSMVGPRPERPHFVAEFTRLHPGYAARHRVPAGVTGLAQIHGLRGDTSIEDRCRFDNAYIDNWSLWQDVCILLRTGGALVRLTGS